MTCARARRLFGACWDDEITQGEREWLDAHLNACTACRRDYDALARTLEAVASLPREEAAPDLLERTLARARRTTPAADRLPETRRPWIAVTATAAAAVLVLTVVAPWTGWMTGGVPDTRVAGPEATDAVPEPVAVAQRVGTSSAPLSGEAARSLPDLAALPADSLFDHSEDVEFILDPVALRRGRAHPLSPARRGEREGVQVERAVISF